MNRTEFLQRRKQGIGGSDVAAVLGLSRWKSPFELWKEKTAEELPEDTQNDVLSLASYLEEYTAQKYAAAVGLKVRRKNALLVSKDYPFLIGNIDREICGDKRGVGFLECKAVSNFNFRKIEFYGLPDEYVFQKEHYFYVANGFYKWGAFAILNRDNGRLLTFDVSPEHELYAEALPKLKDFWHCVETNTPPSVELPPLPDVPKYEGKLEDFNSDAMLADLLKEYDEAAAILADATELTDNVKKQIAEHLASHEAVECGGKRIFYRSTRSKRFDTTRFKSEHPSIYDRYTKETETQKSLRIYNTTPNNN